MEGRRKQAARPVSRQDEMEEHSISGTTAARCSLTGAHAISRGLRSPVVPEPSSPWDGEADTAHEDVR